MWSVSGMLGCRVVQAAALGHARRMRRNYILQHMLGHTALQLLGVRPAALAVYSASPLERSRFMFKQCDMQHVALC